MALGTSRSFKRMGHQSFFQMYGPPVLLSNVWAFGMAFGVALRWLWDSFGLALGWLLGWLWDGFGMALDMALGLLLG